MSNSDYTKVNTNFYDLLPEVYQNDYTKSLFNVLFNRYVTKDELEHVEGYIGQGNPNALVNRNIKENDPHRQAFQLQPMMYSKLGTVEHMMVWKDVLSEMEKIGIDTSKLDEWLTPQKFNWVPPIDIDKLLNFQDYYWYNPTNPTSTPQYLTIKNLCNVAESKVILYQSILNTNGSLFPIVAIDDVNKQFYISGDKSNVFSAGFLFYIKNSANASIDNSYWTTESVEYDFNTDRTIITVTSTINDNFVSGDISLEELLEIFNTTKDCICNGSMGFDNTQFDDNQIGSVLWNQTMLAEISHNLLADRILADTSTYDLWYDTSTDTLKQTVVNVASSVSTDWVIIKQNFSQVLSLTEGFHQFDLSEGCSFPRNEWVDQNYWFHKSVIPNFSIAKQASIPIIEFSPYIEMNEWICNEYDWSYRKDNFTPFGRVDENPRLIELVEVADYKVNTDSSLLLHSKYGDLSDDFLREYEFNIVDSDGAVFPINGVLVGFGGTITVIGDISGLYTTVNDVLNVDNLPSTFIVRNSPGGQLDGEWTIDNIDTTTLPGQSIISVIPTEEITSFLYTGAEIYQTNNGTYTTEYSEYVLYKNNYNIISFDLNTNTIVVDGDLGSDIDFTDYFYTSNGVHSYTILSYDAINNETTISISETLPLSFNATEIFIEEYRTIISVNENFKLYGNDVNSYLQPSKTSKGDNWISEDLHWVFNGISSTSPITNQLKTHGYEYEFLPVQDVTEFYGSGNYASGDFEYKVNRFVQYYLVKAVSGINTLELHNVLNKNVLIGANMVRVYVRDATSDHYVRQYGTYTERPASYYGLADNDHVYAVELDNSGLFSQYSEVIIEVGPLVVDDIGLLNVNVRNQEDDILFDSDNALYSEEAKLITFEKHEQIKTELNQYPIFNLFDATGQSLKQVSEIFRFKEASTSDIDFNINKRIVIENNDYIFEQGLLESDNGELFTYRNLNASHGIYFVNSNTNEVFIWNDSWHKKHFSNGVYLTPIVSDIEPTNIEDMNTGQVWFNPETKLLYVYDGLDFISVAFEYHTVDPTLKTIWEPGNNDETYIPKYVDSERNEIAVGDELGEWEIPDPLYYNVHHENRKEISLLNLTGHINTIIDAQETIPGFSGAANNTFHINSNPNYGLGGTIRNYNDNFDVLLSSIFIDTVTTETILDFGKNQYLRSLNNVKEILIQNINGYMTDVLLNGNDVLLQHIIDDVIASYELNDINGLIYKDSPSYDGVNGIKNWVATLPMFEFFNAVSPYIIDREQKLMRHHDNHISRVVINETIKEGLIVQLLNTDDVRINNGDKFGNNRSQYTLLPPSTFSNFISDFNATEISSIKYWYTKTGQDKTLYRLNITVISSTAPSTNFQVGDRWFNDSTFTLYEFDGSNWQIKTAFGDGIIESAWDVIDIDDINLELVNEIEKRLYSVVTGNVHLSNTEIESVSNFQEQEEVEFTKYVKDNAIDAPLSQLNVYDIADAFTWNYIKSTLIDVPHSTSPTGDNIAGSWQGLYESVYGTPYPHREPWVLQGYMNKPSWWDSEYLDDTGTRIWKYDHITTTGMWDNIINGLVPVGYTLPNGAVSTGIVGEVVQYNYLSVMIDDSTQGGINPDDILPPFWDFTAYYGATYTGPVRSLYSNYTAEIVTPHIDFNYGDNGTQEWLWKNSLDYQYSLLVTFFKISPLEFYNKTFGLRHNIINDLQVDSIFNKVYSHIDSVFHGDIYDNDKIYLINGINQWFANFNRFFGVDISISTFKSQWNDWTTPLVYQFGSFVDLETFNITNKNFDIVNNDFNVTMKKSLGIVESKLAALNVEVLNIPHEKLLFGTEYKWRFNIFTNLVNDVEYYDVKNYPVTFDLNTGFFNVYEFEIELLESPNQTITISGDWVNIFENGLDIVNSTNNDGVFTVSAIRYDNTTNLTIITVNEVIDDSIIDGYVKSSYRTLDWDIGQEVYLESTEMLPRPFEVNRAYYVTSVTPTTVLLADTLRDALDGNYIEVEFDGTGQVFIGQVDNTFSALSNINDLNVWKSYTIDKSNQLLFNTNKVVYGIQNVINLVRGYESMLVDSGWSFNYDNGEIDVATGRVVNWQLEIEKFINELKVIQDNKQIVNDSYEFVSVAGELEFTAFNPIWETGTKVLLNSTDLPAPLIRNTPYFIIRTENLNVFELALTELDAKNGNSITILDDGNVSSIESYNVKNSIYIFELNPFKNNIWYKNEQGIISNIITGPFNDIGVGNTIYDQDKNLLDVGDIAIYREDKISKILLKNPVVTVNDKHINGMNLYIDGYEHVMVLSDYSFDGFLIYDPFIGLNTTRFDLVFDKQSGFSLRPNIGGRFLSNGDEFISNIESLTKDLESAYSTYATNESNQMTKLARRGLGYDETEQTFLDKLGINDKSQFIFWKGLIQHKGSVNSIQAFINSRRFVDAKLDEFWAYRLANFGDSKRKLYPEIKIKQADTLSQSVKYEFIENGASPIVDFTPITIDDQDRWFEYPTQKETLVKNFKDHFYFNAEITEIYDQDAIMGGLNGSGNWYFQTALDFDNLILRYEQVTTGTNREEVDMVEGVDYNIINSKIIEFITNPNIDTLKMYTLNVAKTKHNPVKLFDYVSNIKILDLPIWNPAKGHHYHISNNIIDMYADSDPAEYTNMELHPVPSNELDPWSVEHVGDVWLDTKSMGFYPYHDSKRVPEVVDRISNWGKLADYSNVEMYQWTQSEISPTEWNAIAETEELDITISDQIKKTGRVREIVYNVGDGVYEEFNRYYEEFHIIEPTISHSLGNDIYNGIRKVEIEEYIATITPKNDYRAYVNGVENATIDIVPDVGYREVDYDGNLLLTTSIGLTGTYDFNINENGNGLVNVEIILAGGEDVLTLLSLIDAQLTESTTSLVNGNMRITSNIITDDSLIEIEPGDNNDLFSQIANFVEINNTTTINKSITFTGNVTNADLKTIIKFPYDRLNDDGTRLYPTQDEMDSGAYIIDIPHTQIITRNEDGSDNVTYYFWVKDKTVKINGLTSLLQARQNFNEIPVPYVIIENFIPQDDTYRNDGFDYKLPNRYNQLIIKSLGTQVNDNNRYKLRFLHDFTLRDDINDHPTELSLKNNHSEWKLFRQNQPFHIDRYLWDKIIESVIGKTIDGTNKRVPLLEKELYDLENTTSTRYGIGSGQIFLDRDLIIDVINDDLFNPDNDFYPIDIDSFVQTHNFDTEESSIDFMEALYNSFASEHLNRIYFAILHVALTKNLQYVDIMKTSYISLHGIRIIEENGIFDD